MSTDYAHKIRPEPKRGDGPAVHAEYHVVRAIAFAKGWLDPTAATTESRPHRDRRPDGDDMEPQIGNQAYIQWLSDIITDATRRPVPWLAVNLAVTMDRLVRAHEAEADGGPKCAECVALAGGPR